jgi:hypothetical protein
MVAGTHEPVSPSKRSRRVVVIADKDKVGRGHAFAIASALHKIVPSVKLIELPDRAEVKVKDSADFFTAGGNSQELEEIIAAAPDFVSTRESVRSDTGEPKNPTSDEEEDDSDPDEAKQSARKSASTQLVKFADEFAFFHDPQFRPFVRL